MEEGEAIKAYEGGIMGMAHITGIINLRIADAMERTLDKQEKQLLHELQKELYQALEKMTEKALNAKEPPSPLIILAALCRATGEIGVKITLTIINHLEEEISSQQ